MDAARRTGELFRNSATDYGRDVSQSTVTDFPLPACVLVVLSCTVVLRRSVLLVGLSTVSSETAERFHQSSENLDTVGQMRPLSLMNNLWSSAPSWPKPASGTGLPGNDGP